MEILGLILLIIGFIISLIYGIKLIIIAFQESVVWGLLYLFIPLASLVFIITHWDESKEPFIKGLIGALFILVAYMIMPTSTIY